MTSDPSIAVFGASGHTGRFVVDVLDTAGVHAIPVTRTGRFTAIDGRERQGRALDVQDSMALDAAVVGADAVINCAGPFFDTAEPVARAAIRAGIHYLDVAAEQWTTQRLFDRLHRPARKAQVLLVPAMAFYGGLADLLVSALAGEFASIDDVQIAVGLDSRRPTFGTRKTGARNHHDRLIVRGGELTPMPTPPPSTEWTFPPPFGIQHVQCVPLSEIILLSRHISANSITSYMNQRPLRDLADAATPPPEAVDERGRSAQRFVLDTRVVIGGEERRAHVAGQDIYAVSAALVVQACLTLLSLGPSMAGVRAPGEVFDPISLLTSLGPDLVTHLPDPTDFA